MDSKTIDQIEITDAPLIEGLIFRRFRGEDDFPHMVKVIDDSLQADQVQRVQTIEETRANYDNLQNCDPATDMVMAEVNGELVGYARAMWFQEDATKIRSYVHFGFLKP